MCCQRRLAVSNLLREISLILCRRLQRGGVALMPLTMAKPGETVTIRIALDKSMANRVMI